MDAAIALLGLIGIALIVFYVRLSPGKRKTLPPGPPADPLIGHLRIIPTTGQDVFFYELGKRYGDVVQLMVMGRPLIVLNSVDAASDLLDKRSSNYSDRPKFPVYELGGLGDALTFTGYGKEFRTQRRMFQQYFNNSNRHEHHRPIQTHAARILAINLLTVPDNWCRFLSRFASAIIVEIGYGHRITSDDDAYLEIIEDCVTFIAGSGPPGATAIDIFPILRYFPSWFPGTYYAKYARHALPSFKKLREYPLSQVAAEMAQGTARLSFLLTQLEALRESGDEVTSSVTKQIQAASAIFYIAGADTTSASLAFFVLAMVLHPECQVRAQEEIVSILGSDRLPEFQDRERLPYVECLMQETLRWNHVGPVGVPHKSMEDDVFRGMFIPKGSVIIPNIRGMTLDETVYKDPFKFDPTRFLPAPSGRGEPFSTAQFGFGRRICPGRFLADDSLWIAIATILATSTFSKALDDDGKEIIPDAVPVASGITSHPIPFDCRIESRSKASTELLKHSSEA